jgi:hypothetical protein
LDASPFKGLIALRVLDLNSIDYLTEIKASLSSSSSSSFYSLFPISIKDNHFAHL